MPGASIPQLQDAVRKSADIALTAAGAVIFIPALILLVLGHQTRGWQEWLAFLVAASLWTAGLLPRLRPWRRIIQTLAGVLLLITPVIVAPWGGPGWVNLTNVAFAIIVGIVFSFEYVLSIILIAAVAAIDAVVALQSPPAVAFPTDDLFGGLMGPLLDIVCGLGLAYAHREWVRLTRETDRLQADLLAMEEASRRESEMAQARQAVERRIHETVLNTLTGVSMGLDAGSARAARQSCIRDLEQLELGALPPPHTRVADIISSVAFSIPVTALRCHVSVDTEIELPVAQATALRDAIVEALRNVHRHAFVQDVTISATQGSGILIVRVIDDGVGVAADAAERFGMRNTIRSGMAAVGGDAEITSGASGGTTVTLSLPTRPVVAEAVPHMQVTGLLDASLRIRAGLLGTNLFLALTAYAIAAPLNPSAPVLIASSMYVCINVTLALAWNSAARVPMAVLGLLAAGVTFAAASATAPGCSVDSSVTWLMTAVSGGGVLLILPAFHRVVTQSAVVIAMTAFGAALALSLPTTCRSGPLLMVITQLVYMCAILWMLVWANASFEDQHSAAAATWQRIVAERAADDAREAQGSAWAELSPSALALLHRIAEGTLSADDPSARAQAAVEASSLRRQLGLRGAPQDPMEHLIRRLTATAALGYATVDAERLTPMVRPDPLPEQVCQELEVIVGRVPEAALKLRCFADVAEEEYILTVPTSAIPAVYQGFEEIRICDCHLTFLADDDGDTRVSVRRPAVI